MRAGGRSPSVGRFRHVWEKGWIVPSVQADGHQDEGRVSFPVLSLHGMMEEWGPGRFVGRERDVQEKEGGEYKAV